MPTFATLTAPVREFFTLSYAERAARTYTPAQRDRVQALCAAGATRLSGGRRSTRVIAACLLLREALRCYLQADVAARSSSPEEASSSAEDALGALPYLLPLPPDPADPQGSADDDARVRAALTTSDALYFDALSPEEAARARSALDRAVARMRRRVEARSVTNLRATRWGRGLAALIAAGLLSWRVGLAIFGPANVALHKPVTPSSVWYTPVGGQSLVDGDVGSSFGVHTRIEDVPTVVIDLEDTFRIEEIDVHNRADGWFDDCLPLIVELSLDGTNYTPVGRRDTHFDSNPPWTIPVHRLPARYVRLRAARKTYISLSEVEVFGRKTKK